MLRSLLIALAIAAPPASDTEQPGPQMQLCVPLNAPDNDAPDTPADNLPPSASIT